MDSPRTPGVSIRRIALSCRLVFTVVGGTALAREEQPVDDGTGVEGMRALTEGGREGIKGIGREYVIKGG